MSKTGGAAMTGARAGAVVLRVARLRHAYEYQHEYPDIAHHWCDSGGCFMEDCPVCAQEVSQVEQGSLWDTLMAGPTG